MNEKLKVSNIYINLGARGNNRSILFRFGDMGKKKRKDDGEDIESEKMMRKDVKSGMI